MRSWCLTVAHGLAKAKVPIRIRMDAPSNADLYPYSASAVDENRMGCRYGVSRVPDTKNSRPILGCWYNWEHTCLARRSREFDSPTVHQTISLKRYQVAYMVWGHVVKVRILAGRPFKSEVV